jgi:methyltransferase (TIGR00027 family)
MPVSRTAQGVARARSMMSRPAPAGGDAAGEERLNADLAAELSGSAVTAADRRAGAGMFHHLAARTRFFDERVLDAIASGVGQVVIVGAGYDGRALRFRAPGVVFFELDLPDTQADKRARLARLGVACDDVRYVAADLADGDVAARLAQAGHDATRPSLFMCEGLLLYLDRDVVARLFAGLRERAAPRSTLALSLALEDATATPAAVLRRLAFRRRLVRLGEPPRTRLPRDGWETLLRRAGWSIQAEVEPRSLDPDAGSGSSLLVTAVGIGVTT